VSETPEEFAGQYVTQACESVVYDERRDVVGHVGLIDMDDEPRESAVSAARSVPGPVVILRSSARSWHLWCLRVAPLTDWTECATGLGGVDDEHVALNLERDRSVLRVASKVDLETGEDVKPEPVLEEIVDDGHAWPVSGPHLRVLADVLEDDVDVGGERVGDSTDRRVYMADVGGRGGEQA
jgi:hypothetical protein